MAHAPSPAEHAHPCRGHRRRHGRPRRRPRAQPPRRPGHDRRARRAAEPAGARVRARPRAATSTCCSPAGSAAIERLLPGFSDELADPGRVPVVAPARPAVACRRPGGCSPSRGRGPTMMLSASRDLIEWVTRELVLDRLARSTCAPGSRSAAPGGRRRPGRGRRRRGPAVRHPASRPSGCVADLVVDASGRRSHGPRLAGGGRLRPARGGGHRRRPGLRHAAPTGAGPTTSAAGRRCFLQAAGTRLRPRMGGDVPHRGRPLDGHHGRHQRRRAAHRRGGVPRLRPGMRTPTLADAIERLEPLGPIVGVPAHREPAPALRGAARIVPTASWSSATPPAPSTPSTARA